MKREEIRNELLGVISRFIARAQADGGIVDSASLTKDLNVDSADMIDIVLAVEEQFSIRISDEQLDALKTFGDIVSLVERSRMNDANSAVA